MVRKTKVGVTGANGFIGGFLLNNLRLFKTEFSIVEFNRSFFNDTKELDQFVSKCDVIVHLAALNRHNDPEIIYETNITLVKKIISSLERINSAAHIIISSSSQESNKGLYGKSKRDGRLLFSRWANLNQGILTGMIIPNVYGPFGSPFYNSVVSTFCHLLSHDKTPVIDVDNEIKLIYVGELIEEIIKAIREKINSHEFQIKHTAQKSVSQILKLLEYYKNDYQNLGVIPKLNNDFELKLFNTFICYLDIPNYFPKFIIKNSDDRGDFVEIIRNGVSGQTSFSTTLPGITRGNHFHTRKIERFAVIKGKALIQLRKIGTNQKHEFILEGNKPAYVDMPIWYTHNITNIGKEPLYTIFWINEPYNSKNSDTYFELV